jgi:hypothetical protein
VWDVSVELSAQYLVYWWLDSMCQVGRLTDTPTCTLLSSLMETLGCFIDTLMIIIVCLQSDSTATQRNRGTTAGSTTWLTRTGARSVSKRVLCL